MNMRRLHVCSGCALLALLAVAAGCGGEAERGGQPRGDGAAPEGISGKWAVENPSGTMEITQEPGEGFDHLIGHLIQKAEGMSLTWTVAGSFTPPDKVRLGLSFRGVRVGTLSGTVSGDTMSGDMLDNEGNSTGEAWSAKRK